MGGLSRDFGVSHWGRRADSFDDVSRNLLSSYRSSFSDPPGDFGFNGIPVASIAVLAPAAAWTGANSTNLADSGNWSGAVPGSIASTTNADSALFNQNATHSPLTIDSGRNLQNITFDSAIVNSLTFGTVGGPALLLTAGGTIQTTSTVVSPQTVNAPLVLEGDYVFTSGANSNSRATLDFGGQITPGATRGTTRLTLDGANAGANTIRGLLADNGSGQLAVTMSGTGLWILSGANTYSGGTTINSGTLMTTDSGALGVGPLTINAANNITSVLNLGSDEFISDVTINQSGTGAAIVNVAAGATLTSTGALTTTGAFTSVGPGTLEIDGDPTLNDNSHLNLTGGTLRFSAKQGTATIGTGVTVTIATGAILELAGEVAALSSGSNRVNIINNSQQAFGGMLLVSGTNQQVGAIDGTGDTVVNDGSDLTANHIIQNALIIGGTSGSHAVVTIDASDAAGNPVGQSSGLTLAGSLVPSGPFGDNVLSSSNLTASGVLSAISSTLSGSDLGGSAAVVPEPTTLILALLGLASVGCRSRRKRR
jgi:fibronectin-binding autotransporter adhesin